MKHEGFVVFWIGRGDLAECDKGNERVMCDRIVSDVRPMFYLTAPNAEITIQ